MTEITNLKLGIVFPGQGSQSTGMLATLAAEHAEVGDTFAQASKILGYDLWKLVQDGPVEELNQTDRTQPAMLVSGVAVWRVWQALGGVMPAVMAGHSLGEYTALVCAGVLGFEDAVGLVAERGRCMQTAVPSGVGGMAAILGLDDEAVAEVCSQAADDEVVSPVNYNSVGPGSDCRACSCGTACNRFCQRGRGKTRPGITGQRSLALCTDGAGSRTVFRKP